MNPHANLGRAWQDALDVQHDVYRLQNRAEIEPMAPPFQVLRMQSRGLFQGQFRGKGRSDYFGHIPGLGAVFFDAKETIALRWEFRNLTREQAAFFDSRPHARTALAIRWALVGQPARSVWLPWDRLRPVWRAWEAGAERASVTTDEAVGIGGREFRGADWLGVA
jgi:hypothetical protein